MVSRIAITDCLKCLADEDYQRKAWLSASGPIVSSFTEDISQLFDDTGLAQALNDGCVVFGTDIDHGLSALAQVVNRIDQSEAPQILLDSEEIANVRRMSLSLLSQMETVDKQPS